MRKFNQSQTLALSDIAIVFTVSVISYVIELILAGSLPWGDEGPGRIGVFTGAISAIGITFYRGRSWQDLGFKTPKSGWMLPLWAMGIFIAFLVAQNLTVVALIPFFDLPAPDYSRYDFIRGNLGAAVTMALVLPFTAAIPEELLYRGFLIERFATLFNFHKHSLWIATFLQALVFSWIHFRWGLGGIIVTFTMGLVWGGAYMICQRNLWVVILAHSLAHIALIMQLYFS